MRVKLKPGADARGKRRARLGQQIVERLPRLLGLEKLSQCPVAAIGHPGVECVNRVVPRGLGVEREPHHRLVVAHQRDRLIGADPRFRAHRKFDRAETVGSAVDEIAEKDDRALVAQLGLPGRLVDERAEKIASPVNVAHGENLRLRAHAQRQRKPSTLDHHRHETTPGSTGTGGKHCTPAPARARIAPMFLEFFANLRQAHVPATPREYLDLMRALEDDLARMSVDEFYRLARVLLVKDERNLDKFDVVFAATFKGVFSVSAAVETRDLPEEWLRRMMERYLSPEERAQIEKLGFDKLMETLRQRLAEQKGRHQGGSKWIGTGGTSPFGAYGDNPEGVRIGQDKGRRGSAVKVWDKREFKDFDGDAELGPRNIKLALRRLRQFAREGMAEELDLDGTIRSTADKGYIDVQLRPERRNAVKVLLFLDVGGSMDWHVEAAEQLFSAAKSQFKRLDHFYFHNCLYESVWKNNRRRHDKRVPTRDLINSYRRDYRVVFVGDASMSPYEIMAPGGSVEHLNPEPGRVWLERAILAWPRSVWINPTPPSAWDHSLSTTMIGEIFQHRMFPLTSDGVEAAMRALAA